MFASVPYQKWGQFFTNQIDLPIGNNKINLPHRNTGMDNGKDDNGIEYAHEHEVQGEWFRLLLYLF